MFKPTSFLFAILMSVSLVGAMNTAHAAEYGCPDSTETWKGVGTLVGSVAGAFAVAVAGFAASLSGIGTMSAGATGGNAAAAIIMTYGGAAAIYLGGGALLLGGSGYGIYRIVRGMTGLNMPKTAACAALH